VRRRLLPETPRHLPHARAISITLRTAHLATFGFLLGGHAFGVDAGRLVPYLWLTILSGLGLVATEVYAVGLYWFVLGKGLVVLAKLGVLLAVLVFWEQRVALLLIVVAIASVGSHMPARYRHYSLLHRRVIGPDVPLRRAGRSGPVKAAPLARVGDRVKAR
jgi:hypothetical protein